ncbi:short chain alcohol dehydrogenase [Hortaea werneckii]|nr:short chain alcohol dehydrogenase [Hortaea werneckii]KAI6927011.1 short chain alcohol dehydrogenase [Hortaea werneckii]KAI6956525.1 short chain alcohol dehydrogenase [Hortaea werneckii]KAI6965438.1 short chain alcohol dehydrogenase [Hortaea werneckii]KAI7015711.1 short chain alcohol dehydrogenase [Hortaea werneckii]
MTRTALISGGARGIGRALTRHFLQTGYRVFIFDLDEAELRHTVHVHLAAYAEDGMWGGGKGMEDWETMGEWIAYMETNLTAPFAVSQACIPYMKLEGNQDNDQSSDPGPCIIHIGSFRAHQSDPNQEGYASSKAGQLGLMHSMAISLQSFGIRVNLVAPGRVKVAHESKEGDEKGLEWAQLNEEKDVQDHPSNRAGMPEDIADAVEYLVNAGFVTGQEITVDGGATRVKKK